MQRDVLRWDYAGAVSGAAMRSGLAFAGRVPAAFRDLRHYTSVFHKLLLEEFRASVQQARPPRRRPPPARRPRALVRLGAASEAEPGPQEHAHVLL